MAANPFIGTNPFSGGGGSGGTVAWFSDTTARDAYYAEHPDALKPGISVGTGNPVVVYTWDGGAWIEGALAFKGDKGDKGDTGPQGVKGDAGDALSDEQKQQLANLDTAVSTAQTAAASASDSASQAQTGASNALASADLSASNAGEAADSADSAQAAADAASASASEIEAGNYAKEQDLLAHTQDASVHVTAAEKADFHAPEVTYTTETTLYQQTTPIAHVQSPSGDLPLAPMMEIMLHAQNDQGYWSMLQMALNQITANQALATKSQAQINDLLARIAVLENAPAPEPEPVYDMASALTLHTPPLAGLLGIEIGSVNLIGTGWTAPGDGLLVVDGASTIGLLTPVWIAVNGIKADPSGVVVLTLLGGDGANGEIKISSGDVVTQSGMGNITFYKRIS